MKILCLTGSVGMGKTTAARMLRHYGHGARIGRSDVSTDSDDNLCTDVEASNAPIDQTRFGLFRM